MNFLSNTRRPGSSDRLEAVNMTDKPPATNADTEKELLQYLKQINHTNIHSYCRFCATEKPELKSLTDKALSDCIGICEFLKVDLVDLDCQYLPKSLCGPCHTKIVETCMFLRSVKESQSKLLLIADAIKKMELLMDDDDSSESIPETVIVSAVSAVEGKDETPEILKSTTGTEELIDNKDHGEGIDGTVILSDQTDAQEVTVINLDKDVEGTVICCDQPSQEVTVINLDKDVEGTVICCDQPSQEETVINLDKDVEVTELQEKDLDASNKVTQSSPESEKIYPVIKCRTVAAINSDVKQKTVKPVVLKRLKVVKLNQIPKTLKPSPQMDQKQEIRKPKLVNIQEKHVLQEKTNKYQSVRIRKATDVIRNITTSRRKQIEKPKANDTSEEILSQNNDRSTQTTDRAELTVHTTATSNIIPSKVNSRTVWKERIPPKPEQLNNIRSVNTDTSLIQNVQDTAMRTESSQDSIKKQMQDVQDTAMRTESSQDSIKKQIQNVQDTATLTETSHVPIKKAKVGGKHHTWNNYQWICSDCNNRYYKLSELREHCMKVHKFCAGFSCTDCSEKFYRITQFRVHIRNHRPLLRLHCHNCNFVAPSKTAMWEHVCSYPRHVCSHCDKQFPTTTALERHLARWKRGRRKTSPSPKRFLLVRTPDKKGAPKRSLLIITPEKRGVNENNSGVALEHAYAKTNGDASRPEPNTSGTNASTRSPIAVDKENIEVSRTLKCTEVFEESVIVSNKEENKEIQGVKDEVDNDASCTIVFKHTKRRAESQQPTLRDTPVQKRMRTASPASPTYAGDASAATDDSGVEITIGPDDVEMTATHPVSTTGDDSSIGHTSPKKGNPKTSNTEFRTTSAEDPLKNLQRVDQSAVKIFKSGDKNIVKGSEDSRPEEHSPIRRPGLKRCYLCAKKKVDHKTCWMCSKCKKSLCKDECFSEYHRQL